MKLSHSTGSLRERLRQTTRRRPFVFVSREAETKSGENLSEAEISRSRFNRFRETASPLFCSCFETRREREEEGWKMFQTEIFRSLSKKNRNPHRAYPKDKFSSPNVSFTISTKNRNTWLRNIFGKTAETSSIKSWLQTFSVKARKDGDSVQRIRL